MSGQQRYERVSTRDENDGTGTMSPTPPAQHQQQQQQQQHQPTPVSPPPSFHSRTSSRSSTRLLSASEQDRTLADAFDGPPSDSDDGSDDEYGSGRRRQRGRLLNSDPFAANHLRDGGPMDALTSSTHDEDGNDDNSDSRPRPIERRVTQWPVFTPTATTAGRGGGLSNDGVFANMSAKPGVGGEEDADEKPPTYEQAAADSAPPYWETTILAPGYGSDEVYIDGLPVGSIFSFLWNGLISMSFQFVGFLLTYLLHTTHAAKHGSRAGLGITLIQYGFTIRTPSSSSSSPPPSPAEVAASLHAADSSSSSTLLGSEPMGDTVPQHPNSHSFNPDTGIPETPASAAAAAAAANVMSSSAGSASNSASGLLGIAASDWFAFALMIIGWFILIRALSDFIRARRHEKLVLQSPERAATGVVPVVVEGDEPERAV